MGLHETIKSWYLKLHDAASDNRLLDYKWFLEQEVDTWSNWVSLPLRTRLDLWRNGFTSPFGALYDFETYGPEAYVSVLQQYRLYKSMNGGHRYLIDDKLSQHWMLSDYPENRPTAYGFVDRGYVHGVAGTTFDGDPVPVSEWLPSALREHSRLVLKQLRGESGQEVLVAEYDDGYVLDNEPVSEGTLCREVVDLSGYLVTEYVEQHAYAEAFFPHSPNTIRVLTIWDDEAGEVYTPIAVQRIGTERSRPIDNFSTGGIAAEIDLETGELGPAAQLPFSGEVSRYATHPDTGARIEGASVSNWESIRSTVERLARDNTNIPAIGWDVLLDRSGEPVVIEANTGAHFDVLQAHRPLLTDPRVARIVSRHLPEVDAPPISHEEERETVRVAP